MISDTTPKEVESLKNFLRSENAAYRDRVSRRKLFAKIAKSQGLTNQEIADIYGVTEGAVRALIKRAK